MLLILPPSPFLQTVGLFPIARTKQDGVMAPDVRGLKPCAPDVYLDGLAQMGAEETKTVSSFVTTPGVR